MGKEKTPDPDPEHEKRFVEDDPANMLTLYDEDDKKIEWGDEEEPK